MLKYIDGVSECATVKAIQVETVFPRIPRLSFGTPILLNIFDVYWLIQKSFYPPTRISEIAMKVHLNVFYEIALHNTYILGLSL